ncbi:MAG: hypothetical protein AMXMBFR84_22410 [Candidatus Hydrogenedentota bacterium]
MAFTVDVQASKRFKTKAPIKKVYELVSDVPKSAGHFPKREKLIDLGGNAYRWEMEKIGLERFSIQTIYACQYAASKKDWTVAWTPIEGVGNARIKGKWLLKAAKDGGTQCSFSTSGELSMPLPGMVKYLVSGLLEREFSSLIEEYLDNIKSALANSGQ